MSSLKPNRSEAEALLSDKDFFLANPHRMFRARAPIDGEFLPSCRQETVALAVWVEDADLFPANLVIVKRLSTGRQRLIFAGPAASLLTTDYAIKKFLLSHRIHPQASFRRAR